jgi:hypothetical protein
MPDSVKCSIFSGPRAIDNVLYNVFVVYAKVQTWNFTTGHRYNYLHLNSGAIIIRWRKMKIVSGSEQALWRYAPQRPLGGTCALFEMTGAVRTVRTVPLDNELTIESTVDAYNKSTVYDCPAGPWVYIVRSIVHISYTKHRSVLANSYVTILTIYNQLREPENGGKY